MMQYKYKNPLSKKEAALRMEIIEQRGDDVVLRCVNPEHALAPNWPEHIGELVEAAESLPDAMFKNI
jgi:hypothetical protein